MKKGILIGMKRAPVLIYLAVALGITLPLFQSGFVFLLDMVYGPSIDLSDSLVKGMNAGIPLRALQAALNILIPAEIIQKIALTIALFLPGYGMFLLAKDRMPVSYAVGAGLLYQLNPYVYERFVSGQWLVLLGYGYFPIVIYLFLQTLKKDRAVMVSKPVLSRVEGSNHDRKNVSSFDELRMTHFLAFAFVFSLYPLLSLHWTVIAAAFLLLLCITQLLFTTQKKKYLKEELKKAALVIALFLLINSFWLWKFFAPSGTIAQISAVDFRAFATVSDPLRGIGLNVLNLYGFWNTDFLVPKDLIPLWWVLGLVLVLLSAVGAGTILRKQRDPLTLATVIVFPFALLFSIGYGNTLTQKFVDALYAVFPLIEGLRDTAKVIGVLAFAYALLAPVGLMSVEKKIGRKGGLAVLFLLPFLMAGPLLWGAMGQISTATYPAEWEEVEEMLGEDSTALILPWAQYLRLDFAEGALASNPARNYFRSNVVSGSNTDNAFLLAAEQSELNDTMTALVHSMETVTQKRAYFTSLGITHVVLLKTDEWEAYEPMLSDPSLEEAFSGESIEVFELR